MKQTFRRLLLIIVLLTFSLAFFGLIKNNNHKKVFPSQTVNKTSLGLPVKLIVPVINVNANIQYLGVNKAGEMEVPSNIVDVGWFKLGSRPGEKGSAVIAGHFNGENDKVGVFANLDKLKKGDRLYIEDDKGTSMTFVVLESRIYDRGYAEEVFNRSDGAYLNLVTCDGWWDGIKKSYSKRLVVLANLILDK